MPRVSPCVGSRLLAASCLLFAPIPRSHAQAPNPALHTVFPAGGQAGTSVTVSLEGFGLEGLESVHATIPRLSARHLDGNRVRLEIAAGTPAGVYDLRSVGRNGNGYDVKRLIRAICNSYAYGLSSTPEETNRGDVQSFARYYPRRLPAEVLLDGISQVLDAPTRFRSVAGDFPIGTRAIELPDEAVPSHFLDVFGRPARNSACECERVDAPALGQTLALVGSTELQDKLTTPKGFVARLASNGKPHRENVEEVFMRAFARLPRPKELAVALRLLESQADRKDAYGSLLWSLLATNEFLFNH